MLLNLFQMEVEKLWKRPLLWVELGLQLFLVIGMMLFLYVLLPLLPVSAQPVSAWTTTLIEILRLVGMSMFGGLLLIVWVGSAVASDYQWRLLHLWISQGAERSHLFLARLAAFFIPTLLFPGIALLIGGLLNVLLFALLGHPLNLEELSLLQLLLSLLRTAYGLLPYLAAALFLAVLARSPILPIAGGIAFLMGEAILIQLLGALGRPFNVLAGFLPYGLSLSLNSVNRATTTTPAVDLAGVAGLSPAQAAIFIAAWTFAFYLGAYILFQRQDLTG